MIDFTDSQKKTIASGLTILSLAVILFFIAFVGVILFKLITFLSFAITPVVVGVFLALFFKPYYEFCRKLVKNPTAAVALLIITVFVPIAIFLWFFGAFAVDQILHLINQAPELASKFVSWFHTTFPKAHVLADQLGIPYMQWIDIYKLKAAEAGIGMLSSVSLIVSTLVSLLFFFYFLTRPQMRGEDYARALPFLKPKTQEFVAEQINVFLDIVITFFQRQTIICLIEGCFYGLGFAIIGVPYGFLIGFILGVFNLIPLFGTVICLPIILPLSYFGDGGSLVKLISVLVVWASMQLLDGYFITPKIQGNKTGLGYAGVIFSFFFWGAVFNSLLGLLLAIPLSAFCVVFYRALKSKYIKPII